MASAQKVHQISVVDPALPLHVTSQTTLPQAVRGEPYSFQFEAAGGVAPYTWSTPGTQPPEGLTLGTDGVLSGTPTTSGNFAFGVQVDDSATE